MLPPAGSRAQEIRVKMSKQSKYLDHGLLELDEVLTATYEQLEA
jgi:hypothetical protein